jgi:archaellum biogenesis ATPase FlaH
VKFLTDGILVLWAPIASQTLVLFDSLSDLIVSFGFERSYEFMKNVNEILNERRVTSVFIIKSRAHEERVTSLVRGLYGAHLLYGSAGLSVTRG